ncbi:MAG: hypothetical protein ACPKM0_07005 [Pleomorphochaeta sp.]
MDTTDTSNEMIEFYSIAKKELGDICFDKFQNQIINHKYFLGLKLKRNPSLQETIISYENDIFLPVCKIIKNWEFDIAFKKEHKECLYFSFLEHLYLIREKHPKISIDKAAHDFCLKHGDNKRGRLLVNLLYKCQAC